MDKRIFLATLIPQETKGEIEKVSNQLKSQGFNLRLTPGENLHITLIFLAKVPAEKLSQVSEITKSVCKKFSQSCLFLSGLSAFPNLKLPKIIFINLGGDTGTLTYLEHKLQTELRNLGFKFGEEKFIPHITIARIKSYVSKVKRRQLGEAIQRWGKIKPCKIPVDSVAIFESIPTSAGHIHTLVEKIDLGGSP